MRFPRFLPAALFLCWAGLSAAEEPVVQRVEIEGLRIHTPDEVRAKMETHVGRPYSREVLDRDIHRLFETRWFADVRRSDRSIETGPDAVVVVLEVLENDVLREIRYVGNRHLNDEDLAPTALLKTGEYYAPFRIKQEADRIRDRYLEDGYAWVKVTPAETATGKGTIVTFTVREGPKASVRHIEFHGNEELSGYALDKEMKTGQLRIWNFISPPEYKASQLEEDIRALLRYARGEGFLDARIYVRELKWDADKSWVDIHIQVEEGIRYVVDAVEIEGATVLAANDLYKGLRVRPGEAYALKHVLRDELYLLDRYRENAYVDVEATPVPKYLAEKGHVKLTWRIKEGDKIYVRRIDFVGNHRTREKVLRREMLLLPGEEFNKLLLDASMDRLRSLHYFQPQSPQLFARAWEPVADPEIVVEVLPGGEKDERDLLIHVEEGKTGNIRVGGSYSDAVGIAGELSITQNNFDPLDLPKSLTDLVSGDAFSGAGDIARLELRPGYKQSNYEISFTDPWFLDFPVSMTLAGSLYQQDVGFYRERRLTGSLDFGHRWDSTVPIVPGKLGDEFGGTFFGRILQGLSYAAIHLPAYFFFDDHVVHGYDVRNFWQHNYAIGVGYRIARINIFSIDGDAPTDVFDVGGLSYLSSVTFHVSLDRRFSRTFPSQGFKSDVAYEYAGYPIGGYYDYWKISFRHQAFTTLWTTGDGGKVIFETDLRGGFAQQHYYSLSLPIFERFYAGGDSLRGFEPKTISPKENRDPIGGNIMTLASAEVTFPVIRPVLNGREIDILRGAFFTDWGTVVAHTRDFGYFRWSAGFGVRLQIPLGPQTIPLTVDFGFPIYRQSGDRRQTVHIGFDFGF